jgi:hypothetical protein
LLPGLQVKEPSVAQSLAFFPLPFLSLGLLLECKLRQSSSLSFAEAALDVARKLALAKAVQRLSRLARR